jgi:hypothetical protein
MDTVVSELSVPTLRLSRIVANVINNLLTEVSVVGQLGGNT